MECHEFDKSWGPAVGSRCRGGFDFTLLFEQAILSIVPSVLLLIVFILRMPRLLNAKAETTNGVLSKLKWAATSVYSIVQVTLLVLWTLPSSYGTQASIPAACLSVVDAVIICILSHFEHSRSVQPSTALNLYLLFTLLFDATEARTLWLLRSNQALAIVFSIGVALKLGITFLEAQEKGLILKTNEEPRSPEELSSIYSRTCFWWLNSLFRIGFRSNLDSDSLYYLDAKLASGRLSSRVVRAYAKVDQDKKNSLLLAVSSSLKWAVLAPVPARLCLIGFKYAQPFLITRTIDYVGESSDSNTKDVGYGLIGATALIYLGISISTAGYSYKLNKANTMLRGSLISIIYHKTLCLGRGTYKGSGAVTHMSTDVDRIVLTLEKVHDIWAGTVEIAVAVYILKRQTGWSCVAPITLAILSTVGGSYLAKVMPPRLKAWNQAVQKRVSTTSSMLSNMHWIKMMGLSNVVIETLQNQRIAELKTSGKFRMYVAAVNTISIIPRQLSAPFTFMIFVLSAQYQTGHGLTASQAFTALAAIQLLTDPLGKVLTAIPSFTASLVCFDRIKTYLNSADWKDQRILIKSPVPGEPTSESVVVECDEKTIENNKTTKLHTAIESGDDAVTFVDASFALLQNSMLFQHFDLQIRSRSLVMIVGPVGCGKTTILKAVVGDIPLQKGELRLRYPHIAYCQQSSWLLTGTIQENVVMSFLYDQAWYYTVMRSCAMDEDVSRLPNGHATLIGNRGISLSGGQKQRIALARALYARKPLVVVDDVLSALDPKTRNLVFDRVFSGGLLKNLESTVILATHNVQYLPSADHIVVLDEAGNIAEQGTYNTLNSADGYVRSLFLKTREENGFDEDALLPISQSELFVNQDHQRTPKELRIKSGEVATYKFYFNSIGVWRAFGFLLISCTYVLCTKFAEIWLKWWTEAASRNQSVYLGVYFTFAVCAIAGSAVSFWWMMIVIVAKSATNLHWKLLNAVIHAPLSFFSKTDSGVILNRFSQDMSYVNSQLPICVMQVTTTAMMCIAQVILVSIGSKYVASLIPLLFTILWIVQKVYLRTSSQLRLLDLEQKSPLYSHLTATVEGLPTIRAFGWQDDFEQANHKHLDASQRPVYLLYSIQSWLNLVLNLIVAGLATAFMTLVTQLRTEASGPALGLAFVNLLGLSQILSQLIFYYTELETSLAAVVRIKEYFEELKPEDLPNEKTMPTRDWPHEGGIQFTNVSAAYETHSKPVIEDISLNIMPGQKIGICGRTGSGKSSLLATLFRILELRTGSITIDGIDISTMPRQVVRSQLTAIPQDAFALPGNVRFNISPDQSILDEDIVSALTKVGIWATVEERGGLDADMSLNPLSHGEQQLFGLARAMLRDSKLVAFDEATSSVDPKTEETTQRLLATEFRQHTVLTVTHRVRSIAWCDAIVVMDRGRIVERGTVEELLESKGMFWDLWTRQH